VARASQQGQWASLRPHHPPGSGMGHVFSGPVTDKVSSDGWVKHLGVAYGSSCMQGWRDRQEDAHLTISSLEEFATASGASSKPGWAYTSIFGVMDGHGGEHVARFCERYLPLAIAQGSREDLDGALTSAFYRMDELLADSSNHAELQSLSNDLATSAFSSWQAHPDGIGCTAVVCAVTGDTIVVANAGDSRAVLCRGGQAIEMSMDHKPNLPGETRRIQKAGGVVIEQRVAGNTHYRVNGNLNLSRSIGDLAYKQNGSLHPKDQMICCTPDIQTFRRQPGDEFMIIACDGVWDVLSSQEVVDYLRPRLGSLTDASGRITSGKLRLSALLEGMLDYCLSPDLQQTLGIGGDNMTAVLVVFTEAPEAPVTGNSWSCL